MQRSNVYRPYLRREARSGLAVGRLGEARGVRTRTAPPDVPSSGPRWFVVQTRQRGEQTATWHLRQLDLPTFLPRRLRTVRHARRLRTEMSPLFPGYLFVQFDDARRGWSDISSTPGVKQILTSGGRPSPVASGVVETLLESSDDQGMVYFMADISTGGRVRLLTGPFASELGILESLDDAGRVSLLLDIMNRKVRVVTDRDSIHSA